MIAVEGCRVCGVARRGHGQRWHPEARWHGWAEPTREQIHERMRARLRPVPSSPEETPHA